jgi:hypothetical protein
MDPVRVEALWMAGFFGLSLARLALLATSPNHYDTDGAATSFNLVSAYNQGVAASSTTWIWPSGRSIGGRTARRRRCRSARMPTSCFRRAARSSTPTRGPALLPR